jgi:hypothetical protein
MLQETQNVSVVETMTFNSFRRKVWNDGVVGNNDI